MVEGDPLAAVLELVGGGEKRQRPLAVFQRGAATLHHIEGLHHIVAVGADRLGRFADRPMHAANFVLGLLAQLLQTLLLADETLGVGRLGDGARHLGPHLLADAPGHFARLRRVVEDVPDRRGDVGLHAAHVASAARLGAGLLAVADLAERLQVGVRVAASGDQGQDVVDLEGRQKLVAGGALVALADGDGRSVVSDQSLAVLDHELQEGLGHDAAHAVALVFQAAAVQPHEVVAERAEAECVRSDKLHSHGQVLLALPPVAASLTNAAHCALQHGKGVP